MWCLWITTAVAVIAILWNNCTATNWTAGCHPNKGTATLEGGSLLVLRPKNDDHDGYRVKQSNLLNYSFDFNRTCNARFEKLRLHFTGSCTVEMAFIDSSNVLVVGLFNFVKDSAGYDRQNATISSMQANVIQNHFRKYGRGALLLTISTPGPFCDVHPVKSKSGSGIALIAKEQLHVTTEVTSTQRTDGTPLSENHSKPAETSFLQTGTATSRVIRPSAQTEPNFVGGKGSRTHQNPYVPIIACLAALLAVLSTVFTLYVIYTRRSNTSTQETRRLFHSLAATNSNLDPVVTGEQEPRRVETNKNANNDAAKSGDEEVYSAVGPNISEVSNQRKNDVHYSLPLDQLQTSNNDDEHVQELCSEGKKETTSGNKIKDASTIHAYDNAVLTRVETKKEQCKGTLTSRVSSGHIANSNQMQPPALSQSTIHQNDNPKVRDGLVQTEPCECTISLSAVVREDNEECPQPASDDLYAEISPHHEYTRKLAKPTANFNRFSFHRPTARELPKCPPPRLKSQSVCHVGGHKSAPKTIPRSFSNSEAPTAGYDQGIEMQTVLRKYSPVHDVIVASQHGKKGSTDKIYKDPIDAKPADSAEPHMESTQDKRAKSSRQSSMVDDIYTDPFDSQQGNCTDTVAENAQDTHPKNALQRSSCRTSGRPSASGDAHDMSEYSHLHDVMLSASHVNVTVHDDNLYKEPSDAKLGNSDKENTTGMQSILREQMCGVSASKEAEHLYAALDRNSTHT
ncbi:uncharacterized protein LOC135811662 [Sycon ciliatum]|uniref:uncharacterized protein LOC135811662 n=1 Tax=Sycon ciliatum TaxID=27933 RepID=UPI0031F69AA5